MQVPQFLSRRTVTIAVTLAGVLSLAIGAHAALSMRALDAAKAIATEQDDSPVVGRSSRIALVIGNGHYPDATAPLGQPINDARALDRHAAPQRLRRRCGGRRQQGRHDPRGGAVEIPHPSGLVVMLFFGGYGVQVGRESYMIPVDAAIWKEADVRRDGVSIESVLDVMKERGARAKLVVVDASRRNPYERRFRAFSHGLAPISAPDNALILSSATPGQVADDSGGQNSVLVAELLNNLTAQAGIESSFNKTRVAISRASEGVQVPSVSSSLLEDVHFGSDNAGG